MKKPLKTLSTALLLAVLVFGASAAPALAQEHRETYNAALEAAKAKNYDEAYQKFSQAAQQAAAADDQAVADRARETMAKLDYLLGKQLIQQENFEQALARFEQGIEAKADYTNNYKGKVVALKRLEREDDVIAVYVDLIALGNEQNDREALRTGQQGIRDLFVFRASEALSRNGENTTRRDADEALAALEQLGTYEDVDVSEDADYYYYQAVAHNVRGEHDQAIELANQALEHHRGSRTDAAKIYFVLGEAHMYNGDTAAAKEAFANATYGSYKAPAEHYIETL